MASTDPYQIALAWILFLAATLTSIGAMRGRAAKLAQTGAPYPAWQRLRDVAVPAGMGILGLRTLMIGYGLLSPEGFGSRALLALATFGVAGGLAASRIRRRPG